MKRRRLALVALGLGLGLFAAEAGLQAVAYVLWRGERTGPATQGADVVLCVGDSFTYGLGAGRDGGSYPRQLEGLLRAGGGTATVVNCGWPGQSTREVLQRLPGQLARHRPRAVCVLAGINDPWRRPEPVTESELAGEAEGFPLQLRLLRLARLMAGWLRPTDAGERAFVGTWNDGAKAVVFEPGGRLRIGADELRWLEDERGLAYVLPDGEVQHVRWWIEDGRLHVRGMGVDSVLSPGPPPPPSAAARGEQALAKGDRTGARALFEQARDEPGERPAALAGLVRIAVAEGDTVARDAGLAALRAEFAAGSVAAGEALVQALAAAGEAAEAVTVARHVLRAAPESRRTWEVLLTHGVAAGQQDAVLALMAELLASAQPTAPWRPTLLQLRAQFLAPTDPDAALDAVLAAFLQDGNGAFLVRQLELGGDAYGPARVTAAIERLPAAAAARVRDAIAGGGTEAGVLATMRAHLERIVGLCRAHGATPFLLLYPEPDPVRDRIVRAIAAAAGARCIDPQPAFAAALRGQARERLFIHDGHCTDLGYALLAREVAAAMR